MTGFERIGAERQYDCCSAQEAERTFSYSCKLCASQGKWIDCGDCEIKRVHNLMMNAFRDIEEEKERKREEARKQNRIQIVILV